MKFNLDNLIEEFEELIIKSFVSSYLKGLTPNPCCLCNKYIKFDLIQKKVRKLGCEVFVTGHYARLLSDGGKRSLYKGRDEKKEQSYFLSLVALEDFKHVEMPLGDWKKKDVVDEVQKKGLKVPLPSESQEICFAGGDYRDFLKKRGIELSGPGPVFGVWGDRLGFHEGLFNYTIGQRRGLKISYKEPLYVVDKKLEENILIVGTKKDLQRRECIVSHINYLEDLLLWPPEVKVKCNYNMQEKEARWKIIDENRIKVIFKNPINRPTPGQICCFYFHDKVLGGGIICDE